MTSTLGRVAFRLCWPFYCFWLRKYASERHKAKPTFSFPAILILLFSVRLFPHVWRDDSGKIHFLQCLRFSRPHRRRWRFLSRFIYFPCCKLPGSVIISYYTAAHCFLLSASSRPDETKPSAVLTTFWAPTFQLFWFRATLAKVSHIMHKLSRAIQLFFQQSHSKKPAWRCCSLAPSALLLFCALQDCTKAVFYLHLIRQRIYIYELPLSPKASRRGSFCFDLQLLCSFSGDAAAWKITGKKCMRRMS